MNFKLDQKMLIRIGVGIAALVVVFWVLSLLGQLIQFLAPIALAVLVAYFGYQFLSSRRKSTGKQSVMERAEAGDFSGEGEAAQIVQGEARDVTHLDADAPDEEEDPEEEAAVDAALSVSVDDLDSLKAKPIDVSRLEDREKKANEVTDAVLAQIEERRRRLQGGDS